MSLPFTHLHVASGYSLQYGTAAPAALVEAAHAHGMDSLALTDRDGLYGAAKFVRACRQTRIAPVLGVDLAVRPSGALGGLPSWADPARRHEGRPGGVRPARRIPVRGGADLDPRHPRVTVLALSGPGAVPWYRSPGWARLCRLVSATHLCGERGSPMGALELIAEHAVDLSGEPALAVLLGPASELGRALLARRPDVGRAVLQAWAAVLPPGSLHVEVVWHRAPEGRPGSLGQAARMLALAREVGVPAVLSNAVRYPDPGGAATADVLDASRRLVALDARRLDRVTAEEYLAPPGEMASRAAEVVRAAGDPGAAPVTAGARLLADTEALARRCRFEVRPHEPVVACVPEASVLGPDVKHDAHSALRARCEQGIDQRYPRATPADREDITRRLERELRTISELGYAGYFLTVGEVCSLIHRAGIRVAARGSGAGSLVNHLLGISGVDPIRYDLMPQRFISTRQGRLPDIDIDVESARRTEVYERIIERFGAERVACVSMMETYRIRHAVRDAGAALGLGPAEVGAIATAFPHIRARDIRHAVAELPELRSAGLDPAALDLLFDLVERLDGLPRHVALHPCGVLLSDAGLLDRTPVEASWMGFPMSQFDKDDVEDLGFLKLDVLGVRMQSAMAHALVEIERLDLDDRPDAGADTGADPAPGRLDLDAVPHDDEATFRLIRSTRTLGCFQIESPGQRELIGKFAPETFDDLIIDISLFRPGPVKSDMIDPFLRARHERQSQAPVHPALRSVLDETLGVVIFHEQVIKIIASTTGCDLTEAEERRRGLGTPGGSAEVGEWFRSRMPQARFDETSAQRIWEVLESFGSFGFCKAHAAAFALPTYQSAWLKAHHPAAFLAGVLTHDPGMYPKRLLLDDARNLGITVLPLDVNRSVDTYRVERVAVDPERPRPHPDLPDGRGHGIRVALADVKGISGEEVARIVAGRPYHSLADFWYRTQVSRPVVERLVVAGAFDSVYGLGTALPLGRRDRVTHRDLLLQVTALDRWTRAVRPGAAGGRSRQSRAPRPAPPAEERPVQLALDLGDAPDGSMRSGLPEMTPAERVRAELEVLGMDATRHVLDFYAPLLDVLGVTRADQVLDRRNRSELLVAGVKAATQTPPIRSGRRVVFLTLDDTTGPVDATFFEDVQDPYAAIVFHSWLLLVRGILRRTGPRGVSVRATGAWDLPPLWDAWVDGGLGAVLEIITGERAGASPAAADGTADPALTFAAGAGAGPTRAVSRGGWTHLPWSPEQSQVASGLPVGDRTPQGRRSGGMGGGPRRILVHPSGYRQSPYADVGTPGEDTRDTRRMLPATGAERDAGRAAPRRLWHASPGSSGR